MYSARSVLLSLLTAVVMAGCAASVGTRQDAAVETDRGLIGAWIVTASRPGGSGKEHAYLFVGRYFLSKRGYASGTSGAHGAWKRVGGKEFDATYIAFRFDQNGKWIGSTKTRIHIIAGPGDNDFTGVAKVSTRDLQDKEIGTSEVRLEGKRIQVEPFKNAL